MRILVTGASGFVGNHMIEALAAAGHEVRGLSRRMPQKARRKAGVEYIDRVDVGDKATMTPKMFEGVDAVLHLVGIIQESKDGQTFERIHVEGTRNVAEMAKSAGVSGRFLYMSAIGSAPDAPAEYSRTKYAAEQIVQRSGIPYTIFRPSIILGRDGEFVAQMSDLIRYGGLPVKIPFPVIPVPGSGENKFQPIDIDDLSACVVKSLADPSTAGHTYEVGGATQVTFNELLTGFAGALGVHKPLVHAPIPVLRIAATVLERVLPHPPVTRDQLANLGRDNIAEPNAVSRDFDIAPRSFDEILRRLFPGAPSVPVTRKEPANA